MGAWIQPFVFLVFPFSFSFLPQTGHPECPEMQPLENVLSGTEKQQKSVFSIQKVFVAFLVFLWRWGVLPLVIKNKIISVTALYKTYYHFFIGYFFPKFLMCQCFIRHHHIIPRKKVIKRASHITEDIYNFHALNNINALIWPIEI